MFNIKYFIAYEIPKNETTMIKGSDIVTASLFSNAEDLYDDFIFAVAKVNNVDEKNVIITQFNKVN